jgi:hypothetical protein
MKTAIVTAMMLGAAGCGRFDPCEGATFCVDEVGIYVESGETWMHAADTEQRIRRALAISMAYWGAASLPGVRIHFMDASACGGAGGGCTAYYDPDGWVPSGSDYTYREIEMNVADGVGAGHCVESTPLAHEVGHAAIWDPGHTDPRWAGQVTLYLEQLAPVSLYPDCY